MLGRQPARDPPNHRHDSRALTGSPTTISFQLSLWFHYNDIVPTISQLRYNDLVPTMRAHKPPATISSQLTSRFHCNDLVPTISQVSIQRSCPRGLAVWFAAIGGCQVSLQPYRHPYAGEGPNSHFWNSNFPKRLSGPSGGLGVTTTISSQTTCRSQPGRRHSEVSNKIRHFKWSRPWALMGYFCRLSWVTLS